MDKTSILITSEHGGNEVPANYNSLFLGYDDLLNSHRGLDIGTWNFANLGVT